MIVSACSSSEESTRGQTSGDAEMSSGAEEWDDAGAAAPDAQAPSWATVLDVNDVKSNPTKYAWFDFRPNVKKLILSGAAETEHVAILWYTTSDGGVGLHYHSKTESVYVIEGTQTDGKGDYPTGTVYFNPPGSGHQITNSTGFFILAYASPPDFMSTDAIGEYTPVRIDTTASDLTTAQPFEAHAKGARVFAVPLDAAGGMSAAFMELQSATQHVYSGNYVLVLEGRCTIEGAVYGPGKLIVAKSIEPERYQIAASASMSCLALGVSF